jgi:transcriptional regulator with PAS, ATPase and Fis domain
MKNFNNKKLKSEIHPAFFSAITINPKMKEILTFLSKTAILPASTLLVGETGTGKDLIAKAIHNASERHKNPFVAINCAALPENLIETELFGYKKGAFTDAKEDKIGIIESCNQGTLFLDEIAEIPLSSQAKLLRILETKELQRIGDTKSKYVDIRIIVATNRNLREAIEKGLFRADLFYRISEVIISIPPLRERKEDIPLLVSHFLKEANKDFKKRIKKISNTVLSFLTKYDYPGNVRELRNIIRQAVISCDRDIIYLEDFPLELKIYSEDNKGENFFKRASVKEEINFSSCPKLSDVEKEHIQKVLKFTKGNKSKAADMLGISRTTLYEKMKEYKIKQ